MRSQLNDAYQAIYDARDQVERADHDYRKGGGPDKLNRANRALADATQNLYDVQSGAVRDTR
ncbi:hypothetical protein ABIA99_005267 [Bradyrhizobium sp. LB12.1]|uniref:hypothetical protein n=1 Tax=Bradyrhizobium sp. LB12.1 TaxID=3156327 RepID=UPI0033934DBE